MPVHLYGHPADMRELSALAETHGTRRSYEDAAQAHGAALDGRPVGTFGAFAMFSLYPTKNMTCGEGGMVSLADDEVARNVRLLRNQGMERQYENEVVGFNARMTDIHAAIGRVQLTKVDAWTATRQHNAAFLDANLEGVVVPPGRRRRRPRLPPVHDPRPRRPRRLRAGAAGGAQRRQRRLLPDPQPPPAVVRPFAPGLDLPETERAAREVVSLPVTRRCAQDDLDRIVTAVNAVAGAGA